MAASTLARRAALTLARPLSTFDAVPSDTPATRATSRMVGRASAAARDARARAAGRLDGSGMADLRGEPAAEYR